MRTGTAAATTPPMPWRSGVGPHRLRPATTRSRVQGRPRSPLRARRQRWRTRATPPRPNVPITGTTRARCPSEPPSSDDSVARPPRGGRPRWCTGVLRVVVGLGGVGGVGGLGVIGPPPRRGGRQPRPPSRPATTSTVGAGCSGSSPSPSHSSIPAQLPPSQVHGVLSRASGPPGPLRGSAQRNLRACRGRSAAARRRSGDPPLDSMAYQEGPPDAASGRRGPGWRPGGGRIVTRARWSSATVVASPAGTVAGLARRGRGRRGGEAPRAAMAVAPDTGRCAGSDGHGWLLRSARRTPACGAAAGSAALVGRAGPGVGDLRPHAGRPRRPAVPGSGTARLPRWAGEEFNLP